MTNKLQPKEEKTDYFGLSLQKERVHHGREIMTAEVCGWPGGQEAERWHVHTGSSEMKQEVESCSVISKSILGDVGLHLLKNLCFLQIAPPIACHIRETLEEIFHSNYRKNVL